MLSLSLGASFGSGNAGSLNVLALGAHADDIEIGCGAAMVRLLREHPGVRVRWVVFSGAGERGSEARAAAADLLKGAAWAQVDVHEFRDGYFPSQGVALKECFESLKESRPDLIFTHYRDDRHQDHRTISDLTWQTFRDALVLEFEIPKYDGDLGSPNFFVPVERVDLDRKVAALFGHYPSQRGRDWFTEETFRALPTLRGIECRAREGYAEAFYGRKIVI